MLPVCDQRPVHKQDACVTKNMIIRDAVEADLPAIVEIYNAAIWPAQVAALGSGLAILVLLRRGGAGRSRAASVCKAKSIW